MKHESQNHNNKRNKMKVKQQAMWSKKQESKKIKSNWEFLEFRCLGSNPQIDDEVNDLELPPVEDKVTDAIIYNSYVECGNEIRATKEKIGEDVSQWMEKSNKLLQDQQSAIHHSCHTSPMALNAKNELDELDQKIRTNWNLSTNCGSYIPKMDHFEADKDKFSKSDRRVIRSDLNSSIMPVSSLEIPMDMTPMYESNSREARRKKNMYLRNQSKELKQRINKKNEIHSPKTEQRMTHINPRESLSCVREHEAKSSPTLTRKEQQFDTIISSSNTSIVEINIKPKTSDTTLPAMIPSNEESNKYSCNVTHFYPSPLACFDMKNQQNQSPQNENIISMFQNKFKPCIEDTKIQSENKTVPDMLNLSDLNDKQDNQSLIKDNDSKLISSMNHLSFSPPGNSITSKTNSNRSVTRRTISLPPSMRSCQRTRMRRLTGMTQT